MGAQAEPRKEESVHPTAFRARRILAAVAILAELYSSLGRDENIRTYQGPREQSKQTKGRKNVTWQRAHARLLGATTTEAGHRTGAISGRRTEAEGRGTSC
jgi:hypothetical protein